MYKKNVFVLSLALILNIQASEHKHTAIVSQLDLPETMGMKDLSDTMMTTMNVARIPKKSPLCPAFAKHKFSIPFLRLQRVCMIEALEKKAGACKAELKSVLECLSNSHISEERKKSIQESFVSVAIEQYKKALICICELKQSYQKDFGVVL